MWDSGKRAGTLELELAPGVAVEFGNISINLVCANTSLSRVAVRIRKNLHLQVAWLIVDTPKILAVAEMMMMLLMAFLIF